MDKEWVSLVLDTALHYARDKGWAVLPLHCFYGPSRRCTCGEETCQNVAKHPRTKHGLKDASKDEKIIRAWWQRWPLSNLGIATGEVSGIFVLDIDPRHEGDKNLAELERQNGKLPRTGTVITGGGGQHFYFRYPSDGTLISNRANIVPGIDVRGTGGFVVAPPSIHASGKAYEWLPKLLA